MSLLERIQKICWPMAAIFAVLGVGASTGCRVLPAGNPDHVWLLHGLLLAAGFAAGVATMLRAVEIDRKRWEIVEDPLLTSGEREYAHKEAERQRRLAGTAFLLLPLTLAYWLAHQFQDEELHLPQILLGVTPIVAFFLGLWWGRRYERKPEL